MAQDLWSNRVLQGSAYTEMIEGRSHLISLDPVIQMPLPEPGCGVNTCNCGPGSPLHETSFRWVASQYKVPRLWSPSTAFPNGPWPYTLHEMEEENPALVESDFCGPYVILDQILEEPIRDELPVPMPGPYGRVVWLPDEDGELFPRVIKPIWDVIPVDLSDIDDWHYNDLQRLYWNDKVNIDMELVAAYEDHYNRISGLNLDHMTVTDEDNQAAVESVEELVEDVVTIVDANSEIVEEVEHELDQQLADWIRMLYEVGDPCSHSQLQLLEQQLLAS